MRYAIFSDIHGNLPAWQAVRADLQQASVDVAICLGDVVGYGPKPQEVLDGIREVTANFVLGNHDAAAVGLLDASLFNDNARTVVEWTAQRLSPESHEFFKTVPLAIEQDDILFVHAEAVEPGAFGYIDCPEEVQRNFTGSQARVIFVGHTHHPTLHVCHPDGHIDQLEDIDQSLSPDCRYIINVGSAGEPRNPSDIHARYVIFDDASNDVFFRRIAFDVEAYRRDLQSSGLTIRPFFLDVVDKRELDESRDQRLAVLADMDSPVEALAVDHQAGSQQLVMPGASITDDAISFGETRYQIIGKLGEGGLGSVYRARDILMNRDVALKKLHAMEQGDLSDDARESLRSEAQVLGAFQHPNIVTLYAFEETSEGSHVVMELIEGLPLHKAVEEAPLNLEYFCDITEQVLLPLIAANEVNLIHRDIKPENIMLIPNGDRYLVKLLDFGLAKFSAAPTKQTVDQEGTFLGSLNFLAPEQLELGDLDSRTDLYALGCVLYYALTQRAPFHGDSPAAISNNHLQHLVTPIEQLRPDLPASVSNWVMKLINRYPDDRPATALAARQEFTAIAGELRTAARQIEDAESDTDDSLQQTKQGQSFNWLIPLCLLLLAAGGAWYFFNLRSQEGSPSNSPLLSDAGSSQGAILAPDSPTIAEADVPPTEPMAEDAPALASATESITLEHTPIETPTPVVPSLPIEEEMAEATAPPEPTPPLGSEKTVETPDLIHRTGIKRGLIYHAPFDEPETAKQILDRSGYARNLPLNEAISPGKKGQIGTAAEFLLGGTQSEELPFPTNETSDIAISFWLRLNDEVPGNEGVGKAISIPGWFTLSIAHLQFIVDMNQDGQTKTHILPHSRKFDHIFVENTEGTTRLYVNDQQVLEFEETITRLAPYPITHLALGSARSRFQLDELILWNRPLDETERRSLYQQGIDGQPTLSQNQLISHWSFDDADNARLLKDNTSGNDLGAYLPWKTEPVIGPALTPGSQSENNGAARIKQLAVRPENAADYALSDKKSFILQGWFRPHSSRATLVNTIGSDEQAHGWKLEVMRANNDQQYMALSYGNADTKNQALAENLDVYDGKPHQFSAQWHLPTNRIDNPAGQLKLFVDYQEVASTTVPLDMIPSETEGSVFQIGDSQSEFTIDELTFHTSDDVLAKLPEVYNHQDRNAANLMAKQFDLVYDLDLKSLGPNIAYTTDRSSELADQPFTRVGYFLELVQNDDTEQWVWVTLDAMTDAPNQLGIPSLEAGFSWQQTAENLSIYSNLESIAGLTGQGHLEFWPDNYGPANTPEIPGASASTYDLGDQRAGNGSAGYGCMQIHHLESTQTIFSINRWSLWQAGDAGIGNSPGPNPDWTFSKSAASLKSGRLRIYIK